MSNEDGSDGNGREFIAVPSDFTLAQYSELQIENHSEFFNYILNDLKLTAEQTESEDEPKVFTYVKMLRHFTQRLDKADVVKLAAYGLWRALEEKNDS